MKIVKLISLLSAIILSSNAFAGSHYASGKVTSLLASGTDPAIRITGNISPDLCDGGTYGWLYFQGTPEERNRVYGSALALSFRVTHKW